MSHGNRLFGESDLKREAPYPLLYVCEAGDIAQVSARINEGCDVNAASHDGWSPLIMAAKEGWHELVTTLLAAGATPNPPAPAQHTALRGASLFGHDACIRRLLNAKADPNLPSAGGKTPLMGAAMNGHASTIRILHQYGASEAACNEYGETALMIAEARGHSECVELLKALFSPSNTT